MPVWVNLIKKKKEKRKQDGGKHKRPQMSEIIRVVKAAVTERERFLKIFLVNPPLTSFSIFFSPLLRFRIYFYVHGQMAEPL